MLTTGVFKRTPGLKARGGHAPQLALEEKERCLLRQTANYQLSQWDAEDRILREDFNRDNAALDKAISEARKASPYCVICSAVLSEESNSYDLDVSKVDFSEYYKVELFVDYIPGQEGLLVRGNHVADNSYHYGYQGTCSYLGSFPQNSSGLLLFYAVHPDSKVASTYFSATDEVRQTEQVIAPFTWRELTCFNIQGKLPAGTRVQLCGVKK